MKSIWLIDEIEQLKAKAIELFKKDFPKLNVENLIRFVFVKEGFPIFYMQTEGEE